ncbi:nucleotide exchange factor GrpE [Mycetocola reblochoni]|uniref:Protein GrpE n=2 Tax=Mycetocola reblochoni TaxID=331618 RepID=A0A1R4K8G1_9MICO|nr:nucleotide exchange factor GrpE [Mycetocola reblochoni]RLP67820.1 nucleotide exchange factor GrpE [Mycetocola reblochoni]SJN40474.1 Heat shock protein GrpE [Mycetocola reblochoni REB411]
MTTENQNPEDGNGPDEGEVRSAAQGPEANASGPAPQDRDADAGQEHGAEDPDGLSDEELAVLSGQASAEELAAERLADLQRVTAEYANYRKRTEAGRKAEHERTVGDVLGSLLPVLDDLDRAEKHDDLVEGSAFATIAQKLRAATERLGLSSFGAVGDEFDHNIHEAVFQQPTPGADGSTVLDVVETGYRVGDTLIRAAKVVVQVPAE